MNDAMQDAGLGVDQLSDARLKDCTPWNALDYIHTSEDLQAYVDAHVEAAVQQGRKVDRWVNWGFTLFIVAMAFVVVFK